jgi:HK97 family phage portal protein
MNLMDLLRPRADLDLNNPDIWTTTRMGPSKSTTSGERVGPYTALTLPAYYDCVRILSEDVAKLPLNLYRQLARGKEVAKNHPLYRLLRYSPCPTMTAFSFRETLEAHACSWGNGYAEIVRNALGQIVALYPIHPSRMVVWRRGDGTVGYRVMAEFGSGSMQAVEFEPEDIFHLHGMGGDGLIGYSVIAVAAESMGISLAAQSFAASFFGNGMQLGGVLVHPQKLSETARTNLRESMAKMHQGAKRANKIGIFEEGMKYERTGIPPNEAQFLETRSFQIEEVCRWFRMPPHKVQHLARATFSNIEAQNTEYVGDTLQPWLTRWEQEISRKLLSPAEQADYFAEHQVTALLRGDHNARANFYRTMVNIGAMSPNEVRDDENENPGDESLDEHYMQSNMLPIRLLGTQTSRQPAPTRAADDGQTDQDQETGKGEPDNEAAVATAAEDRRQASAQLLALRPAFVEAANRVLHREVTALGKAAARYAGNPSHLARWAAEFYAEQASYLASAMIPLVSSATSMVATVCPSAAPFMVDVDGFAHVHCDRSKAAVLASAGKSTAAENTPERLATEVMALVMETDHA